METEILNRNIIKRVPKLRFKEFEENWIYKTLGKECKHISYGLTVRPKFELNGIPLVSAREITSGVVDISKAPKISIVEFNNLSDKAKPKKGDIFLSKTGTIGFTARFTENYPIAITQNIAVIRLDDTEANSPLYLMQYFKTEKFYRSAIAKVNQSTIMDLQLGDIRKLQIPFSSLPEQQKIATFLTAVDKKIQQLRRKKELLETYKKGVMQQLFSQEIRFKRALSGVEGDEDGKDFPEWKQYSLENIAYITTGSSNRVDSSLIGEYTFFDRSEDIRTSDIYLFDGEAVIVAGEGQRFVPKYFIGKFDLHQRTYAIMDFKDCKGKFIYYYISFHTNYLLSQAVGSTVKSLRLPMFKKMKINQPVVEEQHKIAGFLSSIDKKIEAVSQQITQTHSFKKGLLQQMFV